VRLIKWCCVCLAVMFAAGCSLTPEPERTSDDFDPPYNYY